MVQEGVVRRVQWRNKEMKKDRERERGRFERRRWKVTITKVLLQRVWFVCSSGVANLDVTERTCVVRF